MLAKKLLENGSFQFDTETDEKLVEILTEKYIRESNTPPKNTKTGCSDCGAELSKSPSGHKYLKRCGSCYLKSQAEKRKQKGRR